MSSGINDLKSILHVYCKAHPNEKIDDLVNFVNNCDDDSKLYDRKNFKGHITASALVINKNEEMLFVIHAVFNRLLPPGGHVENGDESLLYSSMRETKEETGVPAEHIEYIPVDANFPELPFDINSHPIPEHPKKKEPPHVHHDFRYVFRYKGTGKIVPDRDETKGAKWIGIHELENVSDISAVIEKLKQLLNEKT
jgi:ADP-ribose pyrophosphatase YjhB (NUDIX family)